MINFRKSNKFFQTLFLPFLVSSAVFAQQRTISGMISDTEGNPLVSANVVIKGSSVGSIADIDGKFSLTVSSGDVLVFSFIGYQSKEITVAESNVINVSLMSDDQQLSEVVVVGSRNTARSSIDTPLPVDVISFEELTSTGQNSFDKTLQYRIPSFNTVQTPVNDATSLLDPYEIRNMGPSRTLILINGKRKNLSALLYTQASVGRGESGTDLSAIPTDAVKRVEVLHDGASAQYGSDAIAGVVNVVLKDQVNQGSIIFRGGITGEGDGEEINLVVNDGIAFGAGDKGFFNYTADFRKRMLASRSGKVSAEGEAREFGADIADVRAFLNKKPDAGNINGSPETTASSFLVNGGYELNKRSSLYFNAAYVYKKVNSFANYRTPYWQSAAAKPFLAELLSPNDPSAYDGYLPTFDGDLGDYNATLGFKSNRNGWNVDLSMTVGGNRQTYTIRNSVNHGLEEDRAAAIASNTLNKTAIDAARKFNYDNAAAIAAGTVQPRLDISKKVRERSPITFRAGGTEFSHIVGNIDISKSISDIFSIAFGSEFRSETFETIEGDVLSYEFGGPDSFAGNSAVNSFISNRYNIGAYLDLSFDFTEDFLVSATVREEDYSDFGGTFVYKLSSRYKLLDDKVTLRASFSTGFRAPTLHQIYTQKAQYELSDSGGGITVSGLLNNVSSEANSLGVPKLGPEKSTNLSVGLALKLNENFSAKFDYYNIGIKDRIVLGNDIKPTSAGNTTLDNILKAGNISALYFFSNALDSKTSGIDFVLSYRSVDLGRGKLSANLSGNYMLVNERDGKVRNPRNIEATGQTVLSTTQEALMFTSRPQFKAIFGLDYVLNKFSFGLYNTVFGPTSFRDGRTLKSHIKNIQVKFKTKIVTDLNINYQVSEKVNTTLFVNNILGILPEYFLEALNSAGEATLSNSATVKEIKDDLTFNQRYPITTYNGYHFSQLGVLFNLAVSIKL